MGGSEKNEASRVRRHQCRCRSRRHQMSPRSQGSRSSRRSGPSRDVPAFGPVLRVHGCAAALVFACLGAAYGTAKSGVGVANMGVLHADMVMKSIIPIIMAGVLGIYGLIVAVLLASGIDNSAYGYASFSGYAALSAGLCCGMAGLSAGIAIGIVGDAGVRANARQPKLFVGVILILIFAEALGLYGLIVALILSGNSMKCEDISGEYCYQPK